MIRKRYPEAFIVSEWSYPIAALDGCFHADFFHWFEGYNDLFQKRAGESSTVTPKATVTLTWKEKGMSLLPQQVHGTVRTDKRKGDISLPLGNHDTPDSGKQATTISRSSMRFGLTMQG